MAFKESSIKNEYYLGDLPGTLQYRKSKIEIINAYRDFSIENNIELFSELKDTCGYTDINEFDSNDLLSKVMGNTKIVKDNDWEIILAMKKVSGKEIWIKAAILNINTQEIALMTATNDISNITSRGNRAMKSQCPGWYIGRYRLVAPIVFWKNLYERIA